jgi:hypothetical protein
MTGKLGIRIFVFVFCIYQAFSWWLKAEHYGTLELAILPFHEAGHFFFGIFGFEFLTIAGGTIVQIGMPLGFALYFALWRRDFFASSFALFWTFETLLNVAWYLADGPYQRLPLFGDATVHDWNYLLADLKLTIYAEKIARIVRAIGSVGMIGSLIWQAMLIKLGNSDPELA